MTPQDVLKQYESRINLHQFDAVASLIADDAVFWFNDGSFAGHEAIRGAFERTWASLANETYWLTDLRWIAVGDVAAGCIYQFNWKATIDGREASGVGRGTTVLGKGAGDWQIVHEHLSGMPGQGR
nr:nuclear transport factor 2 family protein [uncultured Devosia sp.]